MADNENLDYAGTRTYAQRAVEASLGAGLGRRRGRGAEGEEANQASGSGGKEDSGEVDGGEGGAADQQETTGACFMCHFDILDGACACATGEDGKACENLLSCGHCRTLKQGFNWEGWHEGGQ